LLLKEFSELKSDSLVLKNFKRWIPLVVWIAVIFGLSSIPNVGPENIELPSWTDKFAHFFEYMIFALLYYRGLSYDRKVRKLFYFLLVLMTGFALAGLDEYYQSFVPGRDSDVMDVLADLIGVVAGTAIFFAIGERLFKRLGSYEV